MIQAKFSLEDTQITFLEQHKRYGFKDKSEVVRLALKQLQQHLEQQHLEESATLYAQIYEKDLETRELAAAGLLEWPE